MKMVVLQSGLSAACVHTLNGLRQRILNNILVPHFKFAWDAGPSEFCVQKCDDADPDTHLPFCHVTLTGVSITEKRSPKDFAAVLQALHSMYGEVLFDHPIKGAPIELSVTIELDRPMDGSNLIEQAPQIIQST